MGLTKIVYTDNVTVIHADNLNDIQDAIIALEGKTIPDLSSLTPENLGIPSAGTSADAARADHKHDYNSDFKTALLQLAAKVAYIDGNGQQYYDDLETALTHKTLSSISAVYTQSKTVYPDASLDSLKDDLVVTATYSDSSTATIAAANYTLSGTLAAGTSTITVTYRDKTTTFNVTVTNFLYAWDFKTSLVDTVGGTETLVNSATVSGGTIARDSSGLKFTTNNSGGFQGNCASQNAIIPTGAERIITIKFGAMDGKLSTNSNQNGHIVAVPMGIYWSGGNGSLCANKTNGALAVNFGITDKNYFANKTVVEHIHTDGSVDYYADGTLIGQAEAGSFAVSKKVGFGTGGAKESFGDMVIESVTVKAG